SNADNFTMHGLFHHSAFLFSRGICTLMNSPEYDRRFLEASMQVEPDDMEAAVRALDRYAYDEALLLFTIRQQVYCGMRKGFDIPVSISGHFNFDNLWRIRVDSEQVNGQAESLDEPVIGSEPEVQRMLDATAYPGILYNPEPEPYQHPIFSALWNNIELHELRWKIQSEEMLRTLVEQVTASTNLENVLRSTYQVAILGMTHTGRVLFVNSGYSNVLGHSAEVPLATILFDDHDQPAWPEVAKITDAQGLCTGVYNVPVTDEDRRRVFLTATPAINENKNVVGYVCIFTDHSKEEERLRIRQEMEVAQRIQVAMLPSIDEDKQETLAAAMVPAEEVGGDYYDIITDDEGRVWYGIGDVSGHGVTSGLVMLMTHAVVRTLIRTDSNASMDSILTILNRVLHEDIEHLGSRYHVTFALLKSLGNGDYVAAGSHEDVIIYRVATGECEMVELAGIWLGMMPDIAGICEEVHMHLDPGDTMVLYTDGIIEASDTDGEEWGADRLLDSVKRHAHLVPERMKEAIMAEVIQYMDIQHDDITMMIVRRPSSS
ncbi:MAG: SpoIIE family protein phosphatase, partial [Myxococcota bacterium]